MANTNMSPGDVRATVNSLDDSRKTENAKAVQKGVRLSEEGTKHPTKSTGSLRK